MQNRGKPCATCQFYDGLLPDSGIGLCSNPMCVRVNSQPAKGCSQWTPKPEVQRTGVPSS
jgi:hypothetical protein